MKSECLVLRAGRPKNGVVGFILVSSAISGPMQKARVIRIGESLTSHLRCA
jgi:hypothetical protein